MRSIGRLSDFEGHFSDLLTVVTLCAQLTSDLLAIAKFVVKCNCAMQLSVFQCQNIGLGLYDSMSSSHYCPMSLHSCTLS